MNTKPFLCDFRGLRNLQNKIEFLIKLLWSKLKLFDLEVLYILKTTNIKTVMTSIQLVCITRPTRRYLGTIRACLGPVGGDLHKASPTGQRRALIFPNWRLVGLVTQTN